MDFEEAIINDLVITIISLVSAVCSLKLGWPIPLLRENIITAVDGQYCRLPEFVPVQPIEVGKIKFMFIVEAKRTTIGLAKF